MEQLLPMINLPGAGDPPRAVLLQQLFEQTGFRDLEEDEAFGLLL
jgi:hypothetical protein